MLSLLELLFYTHYLIVPLLLTCFMFSATTKQLLEMRKFAANVMELVYDDKEVEEKDIKNSITKGENSFNRYYHYTKCSYLFCFTHKTTSYPQTPTNCHSFSSFCCCLLAWQTEPNSLCIEMKMKRFSWKGKIKVTRWFHAKNEQTQINLEYGHRRQTKKNVFLSTPLKHI